MNKIISLEKVTDYEVYNPILTLSEDLDYDNRFCVIQTNMGNIAFSYYDLGIAADYIIQDTILFLSFGKGYYILDLKEKCILCKSDDSLSVIFEIIKFDVQSLKSDYKYSKPLEYRKINIQASRNLDFISISS